MTIVIKPATPENLDEEMEPCLEEILPERIQEVSKYCKLKKDWFATVSDRYGVCGFVAYLGTRPVGLIEFLPVEAVPYPEERPERTVFILCAYVRKDGQGKGAGRELLSHLIHYLSTTPLNSFGRKTALAIEVYVPRPDPEWPAYIQFPTGRKEFYMKFGFALKKELPKQDGYLYRLELRRQE